MAFLDNLVDALLSKPSQLKSPYFMKADSDAKAQLERLRELHGRAPMETKARIEQDMRNLEAGILGENQVVFELTNSHMPIIVLHDLYLEHEGLTAQIDFMVITPKYMLVIECKNLYGDIEINVSGDFIRTVQYNGKVKKEGIYSPITQNNRHRDLIKALWGSRKTGLIAKTMFEKTFTEYFRSVVVLANPRTVVNMKYAKKEVKSQIIRCDQLIDYMKNLYRESRMEQQAEKNLFELAEFFLSQHKQNQVDYTSKYQVAAPQATSHAAQEPAPPPAVSSHASAPAPAAAPPVVPSPIPSPAPSSVSSPAPAPGPAQAGNLEDTPIYQELKRYRLEASRAEGIAAYYIYNNDQLKALIAAMPRSLEELAKVNGFNEAKCRKYGATILEIVGRYPK